MYRLYFKRIFDIILSINLIVILLPVLISIFFLVWIFIGFPIFLQNRPGLNGEVFTIYKFKTLYELGEHESETKRQSSLGNFLRKTGLDELPQLFNILQNSMSFVGPRPLLMEYLSKYSKYEKQRHLVKPGMIGLAQLKGSLLGIKSWKKSIRLDIFYVNNLSFLLDIKIMIMTIKLILVGKKQYKDYKKSL